MKTLPRSIVIIVALVSSLAYATDHPPTDVKSTTPSQSVNSGARDFDFESGEWRVRHRVLRQGRWIEFEGTCRNRVLIDGTVNVEEHTFRRPEGTTYGIAIRAFDPKSATWAIWWIDSRQPHLPMDPPVVGRFDNGVGQFFSDSIVDGRNVRTRFIWSHITPTSARWEQASSTDGGKSWTVNWIMSFQRTS